MTIKKIYSYIRTKFVIRRLPKERLQNKDAPMVKIKITREK